MALRQEQLVLIGAVALLGYLTYSSLDGGAAQRRTRPAQAPEFESHPAPALDQVLALDRDAGSLERALFSPPRDTRPLPPLEFAAPPLQPLASIQPPPSPGPAPKLYGELLRGDLEFEPVAGLFEEAEQADDDGAEEFAVESIDDEDTLTPEERMERNAGYRRTYDSINIGTLHFGQIRNADRFSLASREDEPILFLEFDPATGLERWPGQPPIEFARERV